MIIEGLGLLVNIDRVSGSLFWLFRNISKRRLVSRVGLKVDVVQIVLI